MTSEAVALIEGYQPYKRSNLPEADSLWDLHELQNIDKHRFLIRLRIDSGTITHGEPVGYSVRFIPGPGLLSSEGLEDGAELARFVVDPPDPEVDVEFDPGPLVVISQPSALQGRPVSGQLGVLRYTVDRIVADAEQLP